MDLNWSDYCILRDIFSKGFDVEELSGGMFCLKKNNMKIVGPLPHIGVLAEDTEDFGIIDFHNKVVLDVGGFIGDTAVLFWNLGARKVIVYEPVPSNQEFIRINAELNGINAEIHEEGMGEDNGYKTIRYEKNTGVDFGLRDFGAKEMKIKINTPERIIRESKADVAKFDCEGAEICLTRVPNDILRKIPFFIIEVHSFKIRNHIISKFKNGGFKLLKEIQNTAGPQFSVLVFERL